MDKNIKNEEREGGKKQKDERNKTEKKIEKG